MNSVDWIWFIIFEENAWITFAYTILTKSSGCCSVEHHHSQAGPMISG